MNLSESVSLTDSISKVAGVNLSESVIVDRLRSSKASWCEPIRINYR